MAVTVWLTRQTKFNGGRMGAVRVTDPDAADLIKKGDALPFDRNLRRALAELKAAEREGGPGDKPKRGRPPKAKPEPEPEPEPEAAPDPAAPDPAEPETTTKRGK